MERVNRIFSDSVYREHFNRITELETERIFCRHDITHFLDTARIASIICMEENIALPKSVIYAAALLHDIGRDIQYTDGTVHEIASADIAPDILERAGYGRDEIEQIVEAIRNHGDSSVKDRRDLSGVLYRADKLSRKCFLCDAYEQCHKDITKRNREIVI